MTKIDNTKRQEIQHDLDEAIKAIAAKHGLDMNQVEIRRASDGSFIRLMKTDLYVKSVATPMIGEGKNQPATSGNRSLDRGMAIYGITKTTNRNGETLVDYKPNRPKYPFVYEGPRGGRWKISGASAKLKFA